MAKETKMQTLYVFKFCIYGIDDTQSTVQKKMASVHFTTIPCKTNTTNTHIESHIFFCDICPRLLATLCVPGLNFLELFCAFLSNFRFFIR